jgi:hypothetical protein
MRCGFCVRGLGVARFFVAHSEVGGSVHRLPASPFLRLCVTPSTHLPVSPPHRPVPSSIPRHTRRGTARRRPKALRPRPTSPPPRLSVSPFRHLPVSPFPRFIDPFLHRFRSTPAEEWRVDGQRHYDRGPTPPPRLSVSPPHRPVPSSVPQHTRRGMARRRPKALRPRPNTTSPLPRLSVSPSPRPITFFIDDSADAGREMVDSTGRA